MLFHKAALALRLQKLVLTRRQGQREVEVCRWHVVEVRLLDRFMIRFSKNFWGITFGNDLGVFFFFATVANFLVFTNLGKIYKSFGDALPLEQDKYRKEKEKAVIRWSYH